MKSFCKEMYGHMVVPISTPFHDDEEQSIHFDGLSFNAEKMIREKKADSIIISGTCGEFYALSFEERVELFDYAKKSIKGVPLIAGTGCPNTKETIALSKKAVELGYDLIMVIAPYYIKPNQKGLYEHYKRVAEAVDAPIMLYNIPIFTGVNISPQLLKELSEVENIVAIKEEAELNPKQMTDYINCTPDDFIIYCGDDTMIFEALIQGGSQRIGGFVSGGAQLIGDKIKETIELLFKGEIDEVARRQQKFYQLFRIFSPESRENPIAMLKATMNLVGYDTGVPRLPVKKATEEEIELAKNVMVELDLL